MLKDNEGKKRISIIWQVSFLFIVGILTSGVITFITQHVSSEAGIKREKERLAAEVADEVKSSVKEYPAYEWLLNYWYTHSDEMDIEYDADYEAGTRTEEKCRQWSQKYPDLQLRYVDTLEIKSLPKEDQKLYAEIIYSWLTTRINHIKRTFQVDFLFCVVTDENYDRQFFLFSAADEGSVRGSNYEEVYTLGVEVTVSESQQEAMRRAYRNERNLADAGKYVDYYSSFGTIKGKPLFIGMTYNLSTLLSEIQRDTLAGSLVAMAHQIFLSALCLILIFFVIIRPLKTVQKNIRLFRDLKIRETVIGHLSKINLSNEIGDLSRDVISLVDEIDDYVKWIETITAQNERIGAELELANRIQADMLPNVFPPFPGRNEFDIYAGMKPAREVGGDFYDIFLVDEDHLCLVMADVSGKGVPAALFMMACKMIISNNAMTNKSPADILSAANDTICSNNKEEMFVTVWVGILELSSGKLVAANAGHEYPAFKEPRGRFELVRDRHGFVIGGMEDMVYNEYEIWMKPGSSLFLYTDGVTEATNKDSELFGIDQMLEALNIEPDAVPETILANVQSQIVQFVGEAEQFDDITMMCLTYKGSSGNEED